MFKKVLVSILSLTIIAAPMHSHALDLSKAFGNLVGPSGGVYANSPGRYQSGARVGFSAGGLEVRIPSKPAVPQLFSVTMPSFEAGCNGISGHFGGFSFISGQEFVTMLKSIGSGVALGFVTSLVIKTFCAPCEAVIQELKAAAQAAAEFARNACQIGQGLAASWLSSGGSGEQKNTDNECSVGASSGGSTIDASAAFKSVCNGLSSARKFVRENFTEQLQELNNKYGGGSSGGAAQEVVVAAGECKVGTGNRTWTKLTNGFLVAAKNPTLSQAHAEEYSKAILLMNIMGVEIAGEKGKEFFCETSNGTQKVKMVAGDDSVIYCPPILDVNTMLGVFLCGNPSQYIAEEGKLLQRNVGGSSSALTQYCRSYYTGTTTTNGEAKVDPTKMEILTCGSDTVSCSKMDKQPLSKVITGSGLLIQINELLQEAVTAVRTNQPIASVKDKQGKLIGPEILALIQAAPYPLYQAINAAAIYPTATADLMDTMSVLVAEQFAYAMIDDLLKIENKSGADPSVAGLCMTRDTADSILSFLERMRGVTYARRQQIAQNFNLQQGIIEQIRQLNLAIQRDVLNTEMISNTTLANKFTSSINQNISKPSN